VGAGPRGVLITATDEEGATWVDAVSSNSLAQQSRFYFHGLNAEQVSSAYDVQRQSGEEATKSSFSLRWDVVGQRTWAGRTL